MTSQIFNLWNQQRIQEILCPEPLSILESLSLPILLLATDLWNKKAREVTSCPVMKARLVTALDRILLVIVLGRSDERPLTCNW